MLFSLLALLCLAASLPACGSDKGAFKYALAGPAVMDPVYGVSLESTVPAVDLALQYINDATDLLPNVSLVYNRTTLEVCIDFAFHLPKQLILQWNTSMIKDMFPNKGCN